MADRTQIEWTDATWNPITGCTVVSPGCTNCYAMRLAGTRLKHTPSRAGLTMDSKAGPVWNGKVRFNSEWLTQPLRWKKPRMIFVCAHGDLFHEDVPDEWIDQVFAIMAEAHWHTFQVLTKRTKRMRQYLAVREHQLAAALMALFNQRAPSPGRWPRLPLPNVWLGVSVEDQQRAEERIPDFLATRAAIHYVSAEPLLGPIDFTSICTGHYFIDALRGVKYHDAPDGVRSATKQCARLDQIIVGGESGKSSRPMHPQWPRRIRDDCASADVPFFFKQWGEWAPVCAMSEDELEGCYKPVRIARVGEDQDHLNEMYGRFEIKLSHVLHADGSRHDHLAANAWAAGTHAMQMFPIGKTRAGRLLDGREHNGMPQPREVPAL